MSTAIYIIVISVTLGLLLWFLREARLIHRGLKQTADYFLWGDHDLTTREFTGTFSATNATFTSSFLAVAVTAYIYEWEVIWLIIPFVLGTILFAILYSSSIGRWVASENIGSLHEFLELNFGKTARKIGAINTVFAFVGTLGLEFLGIQLILQYLAIPAPPLLVILIVFLLFATLATIYAALGGFREVVLTDNRQVAALLVGLAIFLVAFYFMNRIAVGSARGALDTIVRDFSLKPTDPVFVASMMVLFLPFQFCLMDMWQRCRATIASPANVVRGSLIGTIVIAIPLLFAAGMGVYARRTANITAAGEAINENLAFFVGLQHLMQPLQAEGVLYIVALASLGVALLMAAISTADTLLSSIAYTVMIDLWSERKTEMDGRRSSLFLKRPIGETIGMILTICALSSVMAALLTTFRWSLYDMAIAVFGAQVGFTVPLMVAFYWPKAVKWIGPGVPLALFLGLIIPPTAVLAGKLTGTRELIDGAPVLAFGVVLLTVILTPMAMRFGLVESR